jgi:hypothetical protein
MKPETIVKLRDALTMASDALQEELEGMAPTGTKFSWDASKVKWIQTEGSNGPYEKSEDVNSSDFKAMLKDLSAHNGKLTRDGMFYWKFERGDAVGRKPRKK